MITVAELWNEIYCNDAVEVELPKKDFAKLKRKLSKFKWLKAKEIGEEEELGRLKSEVITEKEGQIEVRFWLAEGGELMDTPLAVEITKIETGERI